MAEKKCGARPAEMQKGRKFHVVQRTTVMKHYETLKSEKNMSGDNKFA
jgi:hypothetical protein